ncbi:MAG TPA: hypothetical protein VHJ57_03175 [Nitrososphaeraceae archaeon]|jgi:hypothetical protein|nr:hypothetical protein [Nitrososphaeraceae archaeon]
MKPHSVSYLVRNYEKYLFTILLLAIVSVVGFTIEKAYPQQEDSQLNGPAMNSQKSDESTSFSDTKFTPKMFVKITSHKNADKVPAGELTINGTSSDTAARDCVVEVDWNNEKPSQIVTPTGPGGSSDYSTWTFNYTKEYREIEVGPNELTSKLTCINPGPLTKWFSVTLTGEQPPFPRPLPVP